MKGPILLSSPGVSQVLQPWLLGSGELGLLVFWGEEWLAAALLSSVAYGMVSILFITCFHTLWAQHAARKLRKHRVFLVFISVVFAFSTVFMGEVASFAHHALLVDTGAASGQNDKPALAWHVAGIASAIFADWMMDCLLIWRCVVLYRGCGLLRVALILTLGLLFVASTAMGLLFVLMPGHMNPAMPFVYLTLAINVTGTAALAARILAFRRRIARALGAGRAAPYTRVLALVVEAELLFAAFVGAMAVAYGLGRPLANVFFAALPLVQTIAVFLIILRIARGTDWTDRTCDEIVTSAARPRGTGADGMRPQAQSGFAVTIQFEPASTASAVESSASGAVVDSDPSESKPGSSV